MNATKMQDRFERIGTGGLRYAKGGDGRYIDAQTQLAYFCFCLGAEMALTEFTDFMGMNGYMSGRQYVVGKTVAEGLIARAKSCPRYEDYVSEAEADLCEPETESER